ncbi:excitatory amino acid transporter 3-like [Uloborus diversus]|uniref:excitatory amino acid transporter 3-like n=1 Tax=Uloborus diversus TaxID=327109 RepID=UPI002409EA73|nr:excitatory amino acid transporter 3-like [Uloborus diversus]
MDSDPAKPSNGTVAVEMMTPSPNGTTKTPPENGSSHKRLEGKKAEEDSGKGKNRHPLFRCLGHNLLTVATFMGVVIGIVLGFGMKSAKTWSKREVMYVNFPGELFLNMLKSLILPLIISSLVAATGCLDRRIAGKIGARAVAYYIATTVLAIILGIILVMAIKPGANGDFDVDTEKKYSRPTLPEDTLMDLVRNLFPPNIVEATMFQMNTVLQLPPNSSHNDTDRLKEYNWKLDMGRTTNILGIVICSLVVGLTLGSMKKKGKPLLDVIICLNEAVMIITKYVIWISPVGVMFLVASKIIGMEDLTKVAGQVGLYSATVLVGILFHGLVVLPLIYFIFVRKNPYVFMLRMTQALATAFGTSSSSATLPITMACLEEKNEVDPRVSRFCLPIGATINMDGTALYEAVAAIFIAQVRGVSLSIGNIIAISITATAASIGAAGIPQAGLVTMVMVLNVVGLPAEDVTLILVVDWILDRFRTVINVMGDAFGSGIVDHHSKADLAELTNAENDLSVETTTL